MIAGLSAAAALGLAVAALAGLITGFVVGIAAGITWERADSVDRFHDFVAALGRAVEADQGAVRREIHRTTLNGRRR